MKSEEYIRLLSKLDYTEGFEGDQEAKTAACLSVCEDHAICQACKSPVEGEFRRRFIILDKMVYMGPYKC